MKILQLVDLLPATEDALARLGEVVRAGSDADAIGLHATSIEVVVTNGHHGVPSALIASLPALRMIAIYGVGFDRVDLALAASRGITVTNTPDVLTDDVADLALALMLGVLRRLPAADAHARSGDWSRLGEFALARRASGRRCGIVGFGRIGAAIATRLEGFGGSIAYTSRQPKQVPYRFVASPLLLAREVEVLFVAVAASRATANLIDRDVIAALGPDGVLINVARGSVVDEVALADLLDAGALGGAGLDVFAGEPHIPPALARAPNVMLSPHVGAATHETRRAMGELLAANIAAFAQGRPVPTPVVADISDRG